MAEKERVLCFPAYELSDLPPINGIVTGREMARYLEFVLGEGHVFVDRDAAENDPSYKQLIPYVVIKRGKEVFCYKRTKKGGESRLHEKWSVGVGGHINPIDPTYADALRRELEEELGLYIKGVPTIAGLIYDESEKPTPKNPVPVGHVHFGVVHVATLRDGDEIFSRDPALAGGKFVLPEDLKHVGMFEAWSQLVIEKILLPH